MRSQTVLAHTDSGRATTVSRNPATTACRIWVVSMRAGESSSPSMTNRPIWESQPSPSMKDRVAPRWGSSELPRMSAATYTAAKPEVCSAEAPA